MKMNHTWFSFWWTMWANGCDIFLPIHERDNAVLEENGWQPAIAEPCQQEIVEFWWDALHEHNISPPGMTAYGRDEANAIFMAGDAAFTLVDSTHYGDFNDPNKSRVAGKVGMAKFPVGPLDATSRSPGTRSGAGRSPTACPTSESRPPRRCWAPCSATSRVR